MCFYYLALLVENIKDVTNLRNLILVQSMCMYSLTDLAEDI